MSSAVSEAKRRPLTDRDIFLASLEAHTNYTPRQRRKILALYEDFHTKLDKVEKEEP